MPLPQRLQRRLAGLVNVVEGIVFDDLPSIEAYVNRLRQQNPSIEDDDLARLIVRRKSVKNAIFGAITGAPGFTLMPVAIPASIAASWHIQAQMILAIAHVYGYTQNCDAMDLRRDIYILLAGDSAKESLRQFGIHAATIVTRRAVDRYVNLHIMQQIWKVLGQKIITKAGQKSLTSFIKLAPLVGAPVGATVDWISARTVGALAIHYYSGSG
jgi:hypothetical protein